MKQKIEAAIAESSDEERDAGARASMSGLGNAAVLERLLQDGKVQQLFAEAPEDLFGSSAAQEFGDEFLDDDEAARYVNAVEADGPGVTGMYLGQVAHSYWERQAFAPNAPGTPFWLDRTVGTICSDIGAEGSPSSAALRPDGAALVGPNTVLDSELKPDRIQDTAVPQLEGRRQSFESAGVGVEHSHGAYSSGSIGPITPAFGMTMFYEPGVSDGVVAYRWRKPNRQKLPKVVPTPSEVYEAARDKFQQFEAWWQETVRQHPWVLVPVVMAFVAVAAVTAILILTQVLPRLAFLLMV